MSALVLSLSKDVPSWPMRKSRVLRTKFRTFSLLLLSILAARSVDAQHIRDHVRSANRPSRTVSESQAADLTLTLSAVEPRLVQTWVRTAGVLDGSGKALTASLAG